MKIEKGVNIMTKQDMKDLLLGKAVSYLMAKNINYSFWKLVEKIELIVTENIEYESYNMGAMQDALYEYCENLKAGE